MALRLWPSGQREGGDGAPPRGRRPTVVEVQDLDFGKRIAEFTKSGKGRRVKRSSGNRGPEALDRRPQIQRDCVQQSATHPLCGWGQLPKVKVTAARSTRTLIRAAAHYSAAALPGFGSTGLRPAAGLRPSCLGPLSGLSG